MPDKDSFSWLTIIRDVFPFITTIILSAWGGAVKYFTTVSTGERKFSAKSFVMDLAVASFAGILTHFACEWAGITGAPSALLISISGHMGAKALSVFEDVYERVIGKQGT